MGQEHHRQADQAASDGGVELHHDGMDTGRHGAGDEHIGSEQEGGGEGVEGDPAEGDERGLNDEHGPQKADKAGGNAAGADFITKDQIAKKDAEIAALRDALSKQEDRMLQMEMALAEVLRNQSSEKQVTSRN